MIAHLAVHHVRLATTLSVGMKTVAALNSDVIQALNNFPNNLSKQ